MSTLTTDIAEIEVEAIEKVVSVSHVEPTIPALTIDAVADSPLLPMTRIGLDTATGADVIVGDRERCVGQFKVEDPNRGATLASRNKVFFTLSSADAKEVPLEFARSPAETGVVSPVRDLLEGHPHPKIREFVNKYLRHLQQRERPKRSRK